MFPVDKLNVDAIPAGVPEVFRAAVDLAGSIVHKGFKPNEDPPHSSIVGLHLTSDAV